MRAKRAELDAERAERQRVEDAALKAYADGFAAIEKVQQQTRRKIAKLNTQIGQVTEDGERRAAEIEQQQAAALAHLQEAGRSAEEIAAMVELPVKRVRKMLRGQRPSTTRSGHQSTDTAPDSDPTTAAPAAPAVPAE